MLKGKTVLLGVTGGIACYKSAGLASALVKQGANVQVLMTRNATEFIGPDVYKRQPADPSIEDGAHTPPPGGAGVECHGHDRR